MKNGRLAKKKCGGAKKCGKKKLSRENGRLGIEKIW